jgi:hypothetical protein
VWEAGRAARRGYLLTVGLDEDVLHVRGELPLGPHEQLAVLLLLRSAALWLLRRSTYILHVSDREEVLGAVRLQVNELDIPVLPDRVHAVAGCPHVR